MWKKLLIAALATTTLLGAEIIDTAYQPGKKIKIYDLKRHDDPTRELEYLEDSGYRILKVYLITGETDGKANTMIVLYQDQVPKSFSTS